MVREADTYSARKHIIKAMFQNIILMGTTSWVKLQGFTQNVQISSECSYYTEFTPFLHLALILQAEAKCSLSQQEHGYVTETLSTHKIPNYHSMQNAWSMDFISWFFTHVRQLVFMLLASLPVGWSGWGSGDNEGGCPRTTNRRSSGPNTGRQGWQWSPCQRGSAVFVITQKVTDIDCVQSDRESQQKGKVRVKWRESEEMVKHHAMSSNEWCSLHVFFIINC